MSTIATSITDSKLTDESKDELNGIHTSIYNRDSCKFLTIVKAFLALNREERRKTMLWHLLRKFIGNIDIMPQEHISACDNDLQLYQLFHAHYHELGIERATLTSGGSRRALQRGNEICEILDKFGISIEGGRYLDYGCSTGTITAAVGRRLGADTHGCDVPLWHGIENKCSDKFVTYQHLENGNIPDSKKVSSFNLVTAFMVLHHIKEECMEKTVRGIVACVAEGGHLLIREHDTTCQETIDCCHFEHALYDLVVPEQPFMKFYDEYVCNYHGMDYWETLINEMGMELIYTTKPWGATRYVYMLFKKSQKIEPSTISTNASDVSTILH